MVVCNDGNGSSSGHVRIYDYNGSAWVQVGGDIDGEAAGDKNGRAVSLSSNGSRVAFGAIENDGNGINSGHVRIYELQSDNSWSQLGQDIDGEAAHDQSGYSVSLSSDGSRVAIGAIGNDGNGSSSGHVRIYDYNGSSWVQVGGDIDAEAENDRFGYSVSLSSNGSRVAMMVHLLMISGMELILVMSEFTLSLAVNIINMLGMLISVVEPLQMVHIEQQLQELT